MLKGVPAKLRGVWPPGQPYSLWELLEHLRLARADILEFCVDRQNRERSWLRDYWPPTPEPRDGKAWTASIAEVKADRKRLLALLADENLDLYAAIPYGQGQTYLRRFLLVANSNAFHLGQMVVVRRMLGAWS